MEIEHLTEFAEKFKSAVVLVITFKKSGDFLKETTGFFLNKKGEVVTNELRHAYSAVVKTAYGDEYPVKGIVAISKWFPFMKIAIDTKGEETLFLKLCTTLPSEGEQVLIISNPLSSEKAILKGIVSSLSLFSNKGALLIKAVDSRWSNGSPVLNKSGQVVGMSTLMWWTEEGIRNICVPAKKIFNLKRRKIQTLSEWTEECLAKSEKSSAITNGDVYMLLGYYYEAIEAYKKVEKVNIPRIHYNMGLAYQYLCRHKEAIEAYKKAINLKPKWTKAHYNLGINYIIIGYQEAALNQYRILEKLDTILAAQFLGLVFNMKVCLGNA